MGAWSTIQLKNFRTGFDWDAEHYHPERLAVERLLASKKGTPLSDYAKIACEIKSPDPMRDSFDLTDALGCFLAKEGSRNAASSKKIGRSGEIIISRLRSYLKEMCLLPLRVDQLSYQLSTEFVVLRSVNGQSIAWLLPFFLSEQIQTILRWSQTGSNHPRFRPEELLGLQIKPEIRKLFPALNKLITEANLEYERALNYYPEAEAEMLERIGWEAFQNKEFELSYEMDYQALAKNERIDAEFFCPRENGIRKFLMENGAKSIGDICDFVKHGIQPEYLDNGPVGVVSQRQFRSSGLDLDLLENFTNDDFVAQNPEFLLRPGDVLTYCVSAGEYLGRTFLFDSDIRCVAASFVTILRTQQLASGYLALFLNSPFGLSQSNMFKRGTSPFYLYPRDLKKVLVAIPRNKNGTADLAWQKRLAEKVKASIAAKAQVRAKLDEATRLVEQAILMT